MYRPTVRYDDKYREYVEGLFHSTSLDRNQIIRLGLFLLGHTKEGKEVLKHFSVSPIPQPCWSKNDMVEWYGKEGNFQFSEGDTRTSDGGVSDDNKESISRCDRKIPRDKRDVPEETKIEPIIFKVGNTILLPR